MTSSDIKGGMYATTQAATDCDRCLDQAHRRDDDGVDIGHGPDGERRHGDQAHWFVDGRDRCVRA